MKKLIIIVLSLVCILCVLGVGFVIFDSVRMATGSSLNGYGALAVYVMTIGMFGRWAWQKRQAG